MNFSKFLIVGAAAVSLGLVMAGCPKADSGEAKGESKPSGSGAASGSLSGSIKIDGSSTVYPIAASLVEGFREVGPKVRVSAGEAGTGAGFKKLAGKEVDIANASKPISEEQAAEAAKAGVEFIELPIAYDGLSIVVHPDNTWLKSITTEQLKKIWQDDTIKNWKQLDPSFPDEPLKLFGPTSDHGSYEYFNEVINGDKKKSRQDYSQNNEYNTLIQQVGGNKGALGYVGLAYVLQNKGVVKAIPVDSGKGPIEAKEETIVSDEYRPLARPLLMYVAKEAAGRAEVKAFIEYALSKDGRDLIRQSGYIPFTDDTYARVLARFQKGVTGTAMKDLGTKTLSEILASE